MNYLSLMEAHNPGADASAISTVENLVGARLPDSYAEFLSQSDGGTFRSDRVALRGSGGETVFYHVYSIRADPHYLIGEEYTSLRADQRIPALSVPIGEDPAGNLFLVRLESKGHGRIYFWDHESEPVQGGDKFSDFNNLTLQAENFQDFIGSLKASSDE